MPWPENNDEYTILKSDEYEQSRDCLTEGLINVLDQKLEYFRKNPKHPSLNTKPLNPSAKKKKKLERQGVSRVFEFYINRKEWRCVVYIFEEQKIVYLVRIMNHREVVRHMK